jgi:FkbM family methyltransferase
MGSIKKIVFRLLKIAGYEVLNINLIKQLPGKSNVFQFQRYVLIVAKSSFGNSYQTNEAAFLQQAIERLQKTQPALFTNLYVLYCSGSQRNGFYIEFKGEEGKYFSNNVSSEKEMQFKQILSDPGRAWNLNREAPSRKKIFSWKQVVIAGECAVFETGSAFNELAFFKHAFPFLAASTSQIFQDIFALYCSRNKTNGFFVEFGATDGHSLSNTWMLEKEFKWKGILCEPGRVWHQQLSKNRNCIIDERCVWSVTGEVLTFNEAQVAELSTIEHFNSTDHHSQERENGQVYQVQTISLNDLLDEHHAPAVVDYMSVDTEGSELEILKAFDFSKQQIQVLSVEHNYTANRELIHELLKSNGYVRVFATLSRFDDWYVHQSLFNSLN